MDTATTHPEMVRVPARGRDTQRASVIWRRDGKVRVELWTAPTWNYCSRPSGKRVTLDEAVVVTVDEKPATDATLDERPTAEMLDFSVEAMGYCHGVHMRPMFSKVWP